VADLIGLPALADDPRFALMPDRVAHVDEIDALISNWMSGKTTAEALDLLAGIAIPTGEIATIPDMIVSQRKQGHIRETAKDGGTPLVYPAPIIDIDFDNASGTPAPKAATPAGNGKPLDGIRVVGNRPLYRRPLHGQAARRAWRRGHQGRAPRGRSIAQVGTQLWRLQWLLP